MSVSFSVDAQFTVCVLVTLYIQGLFINNIDKRLMYNCCIFQGLCVCRWWAGGGCGSPRWSGVVFRWLAVILWCPWRMLETGPGVPRGALSPGQGGWCPHKCQSRHVWSDLPGAGWRDSELEGDLWSLWSVCHVWTPHPIRDLSFFHSQVFKDSQRQAYIISQMLSLFYYYFLKQWFCLFLYMFFFLKSRLPGL